MASPLMRSRGNGCPFCSGRYSTEKNNFAVVYPELSKEWGKKNDKLPSEFTPKSGLKVWWECSVCKHEWQAIIKDRVYGYKGCVVCNPSRKRYGGRNQKG
jgi:hypothetical protein